MDNVEKIGAVKHTGQIKERSKNEKNLIKKFLRNKDVAAWFRGTSIFHLQGANELFNAIRDDTEQRTVHRVRQCLNMIGLDPIIPAKDLKFLMKLSQGNDLAFLWFLMERYYKGAKSSMYNINQQLICSAICHLDMITTLRELDKILPISSGTTAVKKKRRSVQGSVSEYLNIPYLEKIPRPRPYGKPLTINVPDFAVQFNTYKGYTDPNFVVHNECNRWFAQYDFNPGRRVAFNIIRHAIDSIFEDFEAAQLKASTINALCNYHKAMTELEESHRFELTVNIRDRCLEKCFGNNVNEADEVNRTDQRNMCTY